ncbi:MAG: hypothetical protein VKJ64_02930 [Leptolyngbyaceae bacterium]|nr:hypothetical protein [Leptolyngbyaceae bacterium]
MISISPNDKPKWSLNDNNQKVEFISNMVEKHLIPKFSANKEWCDFFEYLSSNNVFTQSGHYYRYLNTFGTITARLGKIVDKTVVETGG